ncbi:nucleotide exchange factor GrpE [Gordonia sp. NB41Y]|uniref:nucleotide exchange factor GrpE n=1 Tax=Gordonia sp. NB41Y TaxID=875808 RepID=UPI0006B15257|nr:nucleotide exchange factor GrpE [Gordonia sp. NB41Y]EMP12909.2 molecular chaperone GrpE [Gordonia sp. NB41Y]WLP92451.1 nucleotide exchange factor GrpE [Gordonia sp. NB41Y]
MTQADPHGPAGDEPITVTDNRRVDPETGEVRGQGESTPADGSDSAPAAGAAPAPEESATAASDEVAELTAALQRERAQFANFKRRSEEEKQGRVAYGKQVLIEKLLPILDDLDRAREHGDLETGPLRAVADKLAGTLDSEGLVKFGESGDEFDPDLHEAVQHDGSGAEPVIGSVYRSGYRLADKVIRTAMVTVTDPVPAAGDAAGSGA